MTDDVEVKFGAATGDIEGGIDRVTSHIGQMSQMAEHATELFQYLGERMLEVFALHEITDFIDKLSELGEQIEDTVLVTGLSSDSVQTLSYAYEQAGGSASRAAMLIARFERYVEEGASGNNQYSESFKKIGVSLQDLRTMSIEDLLKKTADGFRNLKDPIERAAVASQFGERDFLKFLAAIEQAPGGIDSYRDHLAELNDLLSGQTIKALEETHTKLVDFTHAAQGAGVEAMLTFHGAIDGVIEDFTYAIEDIGKFVGWLREAQIVVGVDMVDAFADLRIHIEAVGTEMVYWAERSAIAWEEAERIIKDAGTLAWSDIAKARTDAQNKIDIADGEFHDRTDASIKQYADLEAAARKAGEAALNAYGGGAEGGAAIAGHRTGLSPKKDTKNKEMEDFRAMIEYKEDLAKGNYKVLLELQQELVDESAKLYGKDSAQYYEAMKRKVDIQREADKAANADYEKFFKSVNQGMDQMVTGILRGTQTWQQALSRMFSDLMAKFIENMVIQPKLKWLESMVEQVAYNNVKNSAILASDQATSDASSGFHAAAALKKIAAAAAETYAGVFAWAAPMMGPFAAIPAAAAAGLVMAKDALVGSFDTGTNYVPRTGLAMVHEGEAIIPASQNTGGGGVGVTFNVSAIDAKSFMSFVNNPLVMRNLAKNIGSYMAANPSVRGAY